jgi:hypothetical protein
VGVALDAVSDGVVNTTNGCGAGLVLRGRNTLLAHDSDPWLHSHSVTCTCSVHGSWAGKACLGRLYSPRSSHRYCTVSGSWKSLSITPDGQHGPPSHESSDDGLSGPPSVGTRSESGSGTPRPPRGSTHLLLSLSLPIPGPLPTGNSDLQLNLKQLAAGSQAGRGNASSGKP